MYLYAFKITLTSPGSCCWGQMQVRGARWWAWMTDGHARGSLCTHATHSFVKIFFDAAIVFTNYSLEITPEHQWQVPLGKLFN